MVTKQIYRKKIRKRRNIAYFFIFMYELSSFNAKKYYFDNKKNHEG